MPTNIRRENDIIQRFLLGYEDKKWSGATIDPVDTRMDGAVEVIATRPSDNLRVAIEHTIIEPFKDDKQDFALFSKSGFLSLEEDESLRLAGKWIRVFIPVGTLRGHRTPAAQNALVKGVRDWLVRDRTILPSGESDHQCTATLPSGPTIQIPLHVEVVPISKAALHIRRQQVEDNLGDVIDKALRRKLPKLLKTRADRHILMLERQHMNLFPRRMLAEIERRKAVFPDLARIEIWIVETMGYDREAILYFEQYGHDEVKASLLVEADGSVWP